jgi:hypothetical protein
MGTKIENTYDKRLQGLYEEFIRFYEKKSYKYR